MNKRLLLYLSLTVLPLMAWSAERMKYNFDSDWKLYVGDDTTAFETTYDDAAWKSVTLPHAFNEEEAYAKPIDQHTGRVVWYRKTFVLPSKHKGQRVFIEFEGARQAAEVWVNGTRIGLHENGVMAFGYDLTDVVTLGSRHPNVIAVRTDNRWDYTEKATGTSFQWNNRNFNANYGGLPKHVYLHTTNKLYQTLPLYNNLKTTGVYVYATDIDVAERKVLVNVASEVRNTNQRPKAVKLHILIRDVEKKIVKEFISDEYVVAPGETKVIKAAGTLKNVNFWSWGYGYLYEVTSSLVSGKNIEDAVKIRTGFRKTYFGQGVFKLNDRVLQLKGYAQRSSNEWPGVGLSVPAWLSDYSNHLMVESNGNLVRWMHVTPWKQDVESCDRVGLIQAMPAGDAEKDASGRQWEQRVELMRDAIIYNRNNPSVIFYECGNENISEEHMAEMKAIRDTYDPYGGRAIGSREMLDSDLAEYGGEMLYINKSAGKPVWAMEYCRDEALRLYWDSYSYPYHKHGDGPLYRNANASAYNQNQDLFALEAVVRWYDYWRERPGTGKRVSSGGTSIIFSDSNTHYRGAENYRRSGKVDAMRIPKDAFYAHQVMWDGWVDVENSRTHLVGHWNYPAGTVKPVYVVSSGDKVELFVNGKSLGYGKQSHRFWFSFKDVAFEPGIIKAVSYDAAGRQLSTDERRTAGEPVALRLTNIERHTQLMADGADMVLAEIEVVDAQGQRCPLANDQVTFQLQGKATFLGGLAKGPEDNYVRRTELPVECGVNRVLLRTTDEAGLIRLIARSGDLTPDTLDLRSYPIDEMNGLSTYLSGNAQYCRLDRGPTPPRPSYVVTRVPLSVVKAEAGANETTVINSYDDNEMTEWRNNGKRSTGWIAYTLSRPAALSEICLKLTGWRNRSYRLRVLSEDNTVLWEGETPRSLGYVTLPLTTGVKTRQVRLELVGASTEKDAFGAIVELEQGKNLDLFDRNHPDQGDPMDELRIIEIEFYESAN